MKRIMQKIFRSMPENQKQEYLRQRSLMLEFDRKLVKYSANGMEPVYKLMKVIYEVIVTLVMCIPWNQMESYLIVGLVLGANMEAVKIFMTKYLSVNENGQMRRVYEKLQYMPVDVRIIRQVRMEYLIHFIKIPCLMAIAAQLLGAWFGNHCITVANVLYPVLVTGIYPLLIGWLDNFTVRLRN